jgi:hypothetical protein
MLPTPSAVDAIEPSCDSVEPLGILLLDTCAVAFGTAAETPCMAAIWLLICCCAYACCA